MIAVQVAHLVENCVAEVIHRCVIVGTYLDAYTTTITPIELPKLVACVGYGHLDLG
jgi:hypothetical protein